MKNKYKIVLIICIIILVVCIGLLFYINSNGKDKYYLCTKEFKVDKNTDIIYNETIKYNKNKKVKEVLIEYSYVISDDDFYNQLTAGLKQLKDFGGCVDTYSKDKKITCKMGNQIDNIKDKELSSILNDLKHQEYKCTLKED